MGVTYRKDLVEKLMDDLRKLGACYIPKDLSRLEDIELNLRIAVEFGCDTFMDDMKTLKELDYEVPKGIEGRLHLHDEYKDSERIFWIEYYLKKLDEEILK